MPAEPTDGRLVWIDWMKCLGMLAIVLGHSGAQSLADPTPPFNFKQLGVAFFVFVTGYSLAQEKRGVWRVLYNRLFEVYLFGTLFAILLSTITWFTKGDLAESNYLPFLGGVNVLFNYFPANPTTWYIGTYLHLLIVWALILRRTTIGPGTIIIILPLEIACRAALMATAGEYIAYMLLTNWISVLLLGTAIGRQHTHREAGGKCPDPSEETAPKREAPGINGLVGWSFTWMALLTVWPWWGSSLSMDDGFPFRHIQAGGQVSTLLVTSATITLLYLGHTWLAFQVTRRLPRLGLVEFLARNTLIVFIIHMPMIYAWHPTLYRLVPPGLGRVASNILLFYIVPAGISELLRQLIAPSKLREKVLVWGQWRLSGQATGR